MNITYFIGNGFDVNLGLKTKYKDFLEWYVNSDKREKDSVYIDKLKSTMRQEGFEYWSDMELALGLYTDKIEGDEEFDDVVYGIRRSLVDYLKSVYDNLFTPSNAVKNRFKMDFINPYPYLEPYSYSQELPKDLNNDHNKVNILTLNYTYSIERILDLEIKSSKDAILNLNQENINICHLHGTLDEDMVLGVYDDTQIANSLYKTDVDKRPDLIKEDYLKTIVEDYIERIKSVITYTDIICFYGASMGETDKLWWNIVAEWFLGNPNGKIIYFIYSDKEQVDYNHVRQIKILWQRRCRILKDDFIKKIGLPNNLSQEQKNRIFISCNNDKIFKYDLKVIQKEIYKEKQVAADNDLPF